MQTRTMNQLVSDTARDSGVSRKDVATAVDGFFKLVAHNLAEGNKVTLPGFGTFRVARRDARKGRNPSTGEEILIAAKNVPLFKASSKLKDRVN